VPTSEPTKSPAKKTAPPKTRMAAQNSCARKAPEKYVPSMKGNNYAIALTQITSLLQGSKDTLCMLQRSVKLMGMGLHRCADIIGMVMAQVSMKAALKKWGKATEQAITLKMKQLYWCNLYKPMHWHELTQAQKEHILEYQSSLRKSKMARSRPGRWLEETSSKTTSQKKMSALPCSQLKQKCSHA
jgi:hypothetical protein